MNLICFNSKIHLDLLWTFCRSCPLRLWHGFISWLFLLVFVHHYMPHSFESKRFHSIWSPYTTLNVLKQLSVAGLHSFSQLNSFRCLITEAFLPTSIPGHSLSHPLVLTLIRSVTEWARANSGSNPFRMNLSRTFLWWNLGLAASGPAELVSTV